MAGSVTVTEHKKSSNAVTIRGTFTNGCPFRVKLCRCRKHLSEEESLIYLCKAMLYTGESIYEKLSRTYVIFRTDGPDCNGHCRVTASVSRGVKDVDSLVLALVR